MSGPGGLPDPVRGRLDRHEERAVAEELRRVDDAARLPVAEPRSCRERRHRSADTVTGTSAFSSNAWLTSTIATFERPGRRRRAALARCAPSSRSGRAEGRTGCRARVLGDEEAAVHGRLDVVRLVDLVDGPPGRPRACRCPRRHPGRGSRCPRAAGYRRASGRARACRCARSSTSSAGRRRPLSPGPSRRCRRRSTSGRLSYAMSSMRMKSKTSFPETLGVFATFPHWSSTHCGPSGGTDGPPEGGGYAGKSDGPRQLVPVDRRLALGDVLRAPA